MTQDSTVTRRLRVVYRCGSERREFVTPDAYSADLGAAAAARIHERGYDGPDGERGTLSIPPDSIIGVYDGEPPAPAALPPIGE